VFLKGKIEFRIPLPVVIHGNGAHYVYLPDKTQTKGCIKNADLE